MPPVTLCDELMDVLKGQRLTGPSRVWLSPENLAWLSREVAPTAVPGPSHSLPAATSQAAVAPAPTATPTRQVPAAPAIPTFSPATRATPSRPAAAPAESAPVVTPVPPLPDLSGDLEALRGIAAACQRCGLCSGRTQTVFGSGNPNAKLMFIGEGPGAEEDQAGIPFVGPAGDLLTKIITAGMGLSREDVYMAFVVKCNLPQNRKPENREVEACLPYLKRQIELVAPEVIITLGAVPLHRLLGVSGISRARGQWLAYEGIPVMPTLHPSYLLRVPTAKRDVWADVQQVMAHMGLSRPELK